MHRVTCPACSSRLRLRDHLLGKAFRCPRCHQVVSPGPPATVPVLTEATAEDVFRDVAESPPAPAAPPTPAKTKARYSFLVLALVAGAALTLGLVLGGWTGLVLPRIAAPGWASSVEPPSAEARAVRDDTVTMVADPTSPSASGA